MRMKVQEGTDREVNRGQQEDSEDGQWQMVEASRGRRAPHGRLMKVQRTAKGKKSTKQKEGRERICRDQVRVSSEKEQENQTSDSETGEEEAEICRGRDRIEPRGSRS